MWLTGGISHGTNGLQVADRPIQTPSGHVSADVMSSVGSRSLLEVFGLVDGPESPNVDLDVLTTHLPKHSSKKLHILFHVYCPVQKYVAVYWIVVM